MQLTLKVVGVDGAVKAVATGVDEIFLVYRTAYGEGDQVVVEASQPGHLMISLDDAMGQSLVYLQAGAYALGVPFGAKRVPYSPHAFAGNMHRLSVRKARDHEVAARRNLAFSPWDDHANATMFPRAVANVETRGEAVFAARNAIDGEKANDDHGFWPYTSWGINQDPDATLTVHFGRPVSVDEIVLYLRADFPHDAWWNEASVTFSSGETMTVKLVKSGAAQAFAFPARVVEWVRLHDLIKADDPSPFPALTQFEVWGTEAD